jgi:hypothetical protein
MVDHVDIDWAEVFSKPRFWAGYFYYDWQTVHSRLP